MVESIPRRYRERTYQEQNRKDVDLHSVGQWLHQSQARRQAGAEQWRNSPAELPRIAQAMAGLRGMAVDELAQVAWRNACAAQIFAGQFEALWAEGAP